MKNEKRAGSEEELVCKMVEFLQSHDPSILVSCVGEALYREERRKRDENREPKKLCTLRVELAADDILKRFPELGQCNKVGPKFVKNSEGKHEYKCGNCGELLWAVWNACPFCQTKIDWNNPKTE